MLMASEALEITNKNTYKMDAVIYGIKCLENKIRKYAKSGKRNCIVEFYVFPDTHKKFISKYGTENEKYYKGYDIETELKSYFENNGFRFKRIVGEVCGGVVQAPYWIICW